MDERILSNIRERNEQRKMAEANGIIGGARAEFDVDFLLRYIDAQKSRVIETFDELEEYLQDLNYEHGQDATAIRAEGQGGSFYFAFCTDPDGEWFLETGDPRERMVDEDDYPIYVPLGLGHLRGMGPYAILHRAAE